MSSYSDLSIDELVRQCSLGEDLAAWEEFVRRFHRLIAKVVVHTAARCGDCSSATADDLIQETYLRICNRNFKILRNFQQRHPGAFLGLLKVIAASVVRDHFKQRQTLKRGNLYQEEEDISSLNLEDAGAGSPATIERTVLIREIERYLQTCAAGPDRQRNIRVFWLYYRGGLSAAAIAGLPGIGLSTKGVESLVLRITRELRLKLAAAESPQEKIKPLGLEGILRSEAL